MSGPECQELSGRAGRGAARLSQDQADELELWPFVTSVPCGRAHATAIVREWGLPHLVDDVAMITSELLSNAVAAASTTVDTAPVLLRLFVIRGWLLIECWDSNPSAPQPRIPAPDEESGRGLMIVSALSEASGYDFAPDGRKIVWSRLKIG